MKIMTKLATGLALLAVTMMFAGCAKNPEPTVRQRAQAYTQLLVDEKFDEAVNFFDPDVVARRGRTAVANSFKLVVGVVKGLNQFGKRKPAGFEIRKVDFDTEKTRATLQLVLFTTNTSGGDRKETPFDQKWVLRKDIWYATE